MDSTNFYEGMKQLSDFFGKRLTSEQSDFYYSDLKYIGKSEFDHAIRATMKGRKPMPGNFPTIEDIQSLCPRQRTDFSYNKYETEQDYYKRITVDNLFVAMGILEKDGQYPFLRYCKDNNFSEDDVERVEWKSKHAITMGKIMKKLSKEKKGESLSMHKS